MATKKISELNALTTPESDDLIAIVDASATETKKITYGNISKHIVNVGTEVEEDSRVNFIHSRNLFDKNNVVVGYINADGSINSSDTNYKTSDFILVKPNTTYYITASGTSRAKYFNSSKTPLNTSSYQDIDVGANAGSFTTPANCYYIRKSMTNARLDDLMLNKGSTATSYEPYVTNEINIDNEKYTDTLNVGTSVNSKSRVNVLKGKNLFDKDNVNKINAYLPSSTGEIGSNASAITIYIPCEKNTIYTISKGVSDRFIVGTTINVPAVGVESTFIVRDDSATLKTITTGNNANYLCIYYSASNQNIDNTIIIEKGSSIITPSINVDGETIVNKNVYSSNEVVIGEWLGKPLYRKVVEITNPTLDAWTNVNHNISNMDFGRIVDATLTRTIYGTTSYIPIGVSNISAGTLFTCDLQKTIIEYKIAGYTNITKLTAVLEYIKTTD